jgi:hypothetical protein
MSARAAHSPPLTFPYFRIHCVVGEVEEADEGLNLGQKGGKVQRLAFRLGFCAQRHEMRKGSTKNTKPVIWRGPLLKMAVFASIR